jgi:hypothetical protein
VADAATQTGPKHPGLAKTLVVVAAFMGVIACFSTWVARQALNTDDWVHTSGRLLENQDIRTALGNYAVDQLYTNVDVTAELHKTLPKDFKPAAGPAASGLRSLASSGAVKVLDTDRFKTLWADANRSAHETLISILDNKNKAIKTGHGNVTLRLRPLIIEVADQLGLGSSVAGKLPPDVGNLTVLRSDQLGLAQTIAKLIRGLAVVSSLLTLALLGLAIYLSRGQRWVTVLASGIVLIAVVLVVLIVREVAGHVIVKQLATDTARPAADATWAIGTSLLVSIAHEVMLFGVFFVFASWLASPHPSAVATRRAVAPYLREYPVPIMSGLGVLGLIWLLDAVGSTRAIFIRLVLLTMLGYGIFELRRRTMVEFPETTVGEMPDKLRSGMKELWRRQEFVGAVGGNSTGADSAPAPEPEPVDRRLDRLERLAKLRESGALSEAEFEAEKEALLGKPA